MDCGKGKLRDDTQTPETRNSWEEKAMENESSWEKNREGDQSTQVIGLPSESSERKKLYRYVARGGKLCWGREEKAK